MTVQGHGFYWDGSEDKAIRRASATADDEGGQQQQARGQCRRGRNGGQAHDQQRVHIGAGEQERRGRGAGGEAEVVEVNPDRAGDRGAGIGVGREVHRFEFGDRGDRVGGAVQLGEQAGADGGVERGVTLGDAVEGDGEGLVLPAVVKDDKVDAGPVDHGRVECELAALEIGDAGVERNILNQAGSIQRQGGVAEIDQLDRCVVDIGECDVDESGGCVGIRVRREVLQVERTREDVRADGSLCRRDKTSQEQRGGHGVVARGIHDASFNGLSHS